MKSLLENLKGTLELLSKMFQISLVAWRKGMDEIGKKNTTMIQASLDRMSSVISGYENNIGALSESAPNNVVNKSRKLMKKFTLSSIPDAHQDLEDELEIKKTDEKIMEFPDLSKRDHNSQKIISDVFDSDSTSRNDLVQMSSNLETINHGRGLMSKAKEPASSHKNEAKNKLQNFETNHKKDNI